MNNNNDNKLIKVEWYCVEDYDYYPFEYEIDEYVAKEEYQLFDPTTYSKYDYWKKAFG